MEFGTRRNYIVLYEDIRKGPQFQIANLPENSPFLYSRKRIECFSDYKSAIAAKFLAEEEFRINREDYGGNGLDNLEIFSKILEKQNFIKVKIIGQKRKSIYSSSQNEDKKENKWRRYANVSKNHRYHYYESSEGYYKELAKHDSV